MHYTSLTLTARPRGIQIVIGMAGSGKTTLMHRIINDAYDRGKETYVVNLDPAVVQELHKDNNSNVENAEEEEEEEEDGLPYESNIDIRDSVKYKEVMVNHKLGPNGAILTCLNLFATKFDQVMKLIQARSSEVDYILFDTPGQIEIFTWSASGQIITESIAYSFPTVLLYVVDTPRSNLPATFCSNMLYACSIMFKSNLPMVRDGVRGGKSANHFFYQKIVDGV